MQRECVEKLIKLGLTLEAGLILDCVYDRDSKILLDYIRSVGKINSSIFKLLIDKGYLKSTSKDENYTFKDLSVTPLYLHEFQLTKVSDGFNKYFDELRGTYPKNVPSDRGTKRPLQTDIDRCKKLYKGIIVDKGVIDEELHNLILKCIIVQINSYTKAGKLHFMQALPTWLHQKTYEGYLDDVRDSINSEGEIVLDGEKVWGEDV